MGLRERKQSIRRKKYKEVVEKRLESKTPVQYTRRLKTRKNKKLKQIDVPRGRSESWNNPPKDDAQHIPYSFKEMLRLKDMKRLRPLYRSGVGDTEGMKRDAPINKLPKQGKYESDVHYVGRIHKEVEEEMAKIQFSKKQKTELILDKPVKSKKKIHALKRLAAKKKAKRLKTFEKRLTGFEHLHDHVKFNEVVQAPPTNLTKPRKVGSSSTRQMHKLDKLLQT